MNKRLVLGVATTVLLTPVGAAQAAPGGSDPNEVVPVVYSVTVTKGSCAGSTTTIEGFTDLRYGHAVMIDRVTGSRKDIQPVSAGAKFTLRADQPFGTEMRIEAYVVTDAAGGEYPITPPFSVTLPPASQCR